MDPFGCGDQVGNQVVLVVDQLGVAAMLTNPFQIGWAHVLAHLQQGMSMTVVRP